MHLHCCERYDYLQRSSFLQCATMQTLKMIKTASLIDESSPYSMRVHLTLVVTLPAAPSFYINDLLCREMPPLQFVDIHTLASELKHSNGGNFILHLSFSNFAQGCQDLIVFLPFFNIYSLVTVTPCTHLHYQHPFYDAYQSAV